MLIKGKIHQAEIPILNIYSPNTKIHTFIKDTQLQLKSHFGPHILISGIFSTSLSPIDKSLRQKLNRETLELTDIINQMYLMDIYRKFHPNRKRIYFLLSTSKNYLQNWPHRQTQNKSLQTQKFWNNTLHLIRPPWI